MAFVLCWANAVHAQEPVSFSQTAQQRFLYSKLTLIQSHGLSHHEGEMEYPDAASAVMADSSNNARYAAASPAVSVPATPVLAIQETATAQPKREKFHWGPAIRQSLVFLLAVQHAFRLIHEPSTRAQLGGPFFQDWFDSVTNGLSEGWKDGDPMFVNYVGHPMQGGVTGFIQIQNDPGGRQLEFGDPGYWKSRSKAAAWMAVTSLQFELGPISEASIGNVGQKIDPRTGKNGGGAVDLVITPTLGTVWLMGEDVMDKYIVVPVEKHATNRFLKTVARGLFNPTRAMANMCAGRVPWHRDTREGIWGKSVPVTAGSGSGDSDGAQTGEDAENRSQGAPIPD
jgi:hypothetical protein